MLWVLLGLGSAFFAALVAIFGKLGLKGVDTVLATTIRTLVMAGFFVILSLSLQKFGDFHQGSFKTWIYILLSGLAGALSYVCYFWALKIGPTGGVAALDRTSIVFVLVLSALFLAEGITWKTGLGAVLIALGAFLFVLK
ncbi:MAG TPA: EamA family transporter [Candidatus Saccharimonadales bacterium]|nr:EamA family transporter [Candidatus Saccharimonadales bacterium]